MSNSPLVEYTRLSPYYTPNRYMYDKHHTISKITIHHTAGVLSLEQFGAIVTRPGRNMSATYCVDKNARVGLFCDEKNRPWTSSSPANDLVAVTIEVSNSKLGDPWPVSDKVYNRVIELCIDICKRNNIKELTFTGDKNGSLTFHKFFAATGCVPIDTSEVLTEDGWISIKNVKPGTKIAAADPHNLEITFQPVTSMVTPKTDKVYTINGMTVNKEHRVLCTGLNGQTIKFGDLDKNTEYTIPSAGNHNAIGLDINSSEMVFLIEAQKMAVPNTEKKTLEFTYIMDSKIGYFRTLLENVGFSYTTEHENLGPIHFIIDDERAWNIYNEYLDGKNFKWNWMNMNVGQFSYFIYKVTHHERDTWRRVYHSDSIENINIVQAICALNSRGTVYDPESGNLYISDPYRIISKANIEKEEETTVTCVTVESGYFLMRQNGVTTITGNCPGPYLSSKAQDICNRVNAGLKGTSVPVKPEEPVVVVPVNLKAGVLVRIASTATYYDGKSMPAWVKNQNWYVHSVSGDRVIINKNEAGNSAIMSAVNARYLTVIQNASQQPVSTPFTPYVTKLVAGSRIYTISNNTATFKTTISATAKYTIVDENTINGTKYGKLKSGVGWVNLGLNNTVVDSTIRVGDRVSVISPYTYEGKSFKIYEKSYKVLQVKGDRIVISADGKNVTAAVKASNCKKL